MQPRSADLTMASTENKTEDELFTCLDLKHAFQAIAEHEANARAKFCAIKSPMNFGNMDPSKGKRLNWQDHYKSGRARREFNGVPFLILGQKVFACEYGSQKRAYGKRGANGRSANLDSEHDDSTGETKKRRKSRESKKRDCPALCQIREIVEFPEYKVQEMPSYADKRVIWNEIRGKLTSQEPIELLRRYFLILPLVSYHCNHPEGFIELSQLQEEPNADLDESRTKTYNSEVRTKSHAAASYVARHSSTVYNGHADFEDEDNDVYDGYNDLSGDYTRSTAPTYRDNSGFSKDKYRKKQRKSGAETESDTLNTHLLTLNVTPGQEEAIVELFEDRGWDFIPLETHEIKLYPETEAEDCNLGNQVHPLDNTTSLYKATPVNNNLPDTVSSMEKSHVTTNNGCLSSNRVSDMNFSGSKDHASYTYTKQNDKLNTSIREAIMTFQEEKAKQRVDFDQRVMVDDEQEEYYEIIVADEADDDDLKDYQEDVLKRAAFESTSADVSQEEPNVGKKKSRAHKGTKHKKRRVSYSNKMLGNSVEENVEDLQDTKPARNVRDNKKQKPPKKRAKNSRVFPYNCSDCKLRFKSQDIFENHKRDGKCIYECEHCGKGFTYRTYTKYLLHLKYHSQERAFKCALCESAFVNRADLRIHMKKHRNTASTICDICGLSLSCVDDLLSHKHLAHNAKQEVFECDICGRRLVNKHSLRAHKQIVHSDYKPFECKVCGERFKTKKILQETHAKTHEKEYSYKCQIPKCRSLFMTSEELTKHVKLHRSIPSRFCSICNQGFYSIKELKIHSRTHSGKTLHSCPHCKFNCTFPYGLKKHMKTHFNQL